MEKQKELLTIIVKDSDGETVYKDVTFFAGIIADEKGCSSVLNGREKLGALLEIAVRLTNIAEKIGSRVSEAMEAQEKRAKGEVL